MHVRFTFVSGASTNLYFLSISMRTIFAFIMASRMPMHWRGPAPKGMCAQDGILGLFSLLNLWWYEEANKITFIIVTHVVIL